MITKEIDKYLRMPIEHFFQNSENCTRIVNAFKEREAFHVFDIVLNNIYSLRKIPKLGPACINNIISELGLKGITLGMDISEFEFNKLPDENDAQEQLIIHKSSSTLSDIINLMIKDLVETAFSPCREYCNGLELSNEARFQIKEITRLSLSDKIDSAVGSVEF